MLKNILPKQRKYFVYICITITMILFVICISYFILQRTSHISSLLPPSPDLKTYELSGKVTRIQTSCSDKMLNENEEIVPGPSHGLCDGGSFVYIDDQPIYVASGAVSRDKAFSVNIDSIRLGGYATAKYAESESGSKTLHCSQCSINVK
ncbi:hypothetical protein HY312_01450 [Candidatus Saccharibacteria bacterium]|nr:hypothetical protein [Candidatus Saccharibacteria bacterium]